MGKYDQGGTVMKISHFALLLLLPVLLLTLAACGSKTDANAPRDATGAYVLSDSGEAILTGVSTRPAAASEDNARVFYEIFVGSFSDSDGDGIGDLRGIINRMDYLNDGKPDSGLSLGVEGVWLTPIFSSPSYHKYDVTDYYTIDPAFGTEDDLRELIGLCHERGVKLILDLPLNHSGSACPWFGSFVAAHRKGDASDPYYSFYTFCTGSENIPAGRAFAPISGTNDYYECNFYDGMPEFNYDSHAVRAEAVAIAKHYLDMGVDGFRFDAAKYIYYGDHARSLEFWKWYMSELRILRPDIYTVAEVWDNDGVTDRYYPALNCFNFTTSQAYGLIAETAKAGDVDRYASYVQNYVNHVRSLRGDAMYVPFIANHDTDRAAGYLTVSSGQMKAAANLYLLSPGSPFIYYGEEIGLRGSRGAANTDANRRLAMLWGDGDTVKDPEGSTYDVSKQVDSTVAGQLADGGSLLSYYKKLIMIRKANPEIARGEYKALSFPDTKLGGFTSTWEGGTVCVLHNTTTHELTVDLSTATGLTFSEIAAVIGQADAALDGNTLTLGGQTSAVLR